MLLHGIIVKGIGHLVVIALNCFDPVIFIGVGDGLGFSVSDTVQGALAGIARR